MGKTAVRDASISERWNRTKYSIDMSWRASFEGEVEVYIKTIVNTKA